MALIPNFTVVQDNGGLTATATNIIVYGAPEQERNEAAEFVLWSKTDKDGNRDFNNPDQGDVLTKLIYSVATLVSGLYELIWLRIQFYDAGTNYVEQQESGGVITQYPSIFYYPTTEKVYKAIAQSIGQDPENASFFEEVPLGELQDLLGNPNIQQFIKNVNIDYHINKCITARLAGQGCDCSSEDRDYNMNLFAKLVSAQANFNEGNVYEYQAIIEDINTLCIEC